MRRTAALSGARESAIIGALVGLCALIISTLLLALSPAFRSERPELSVSVLAVTYLAGGAIAGAAAGALRVFWTGRLGKVAIGVLLTAVGYLSTYSLINRVPFAPDGEHLFGLLLTSLVLGTLIGLANTGSNRSH